MIPLTRPLTVFDLETTSNRPEVARIVQIAIVRIHPDGKRDVYSSLVNPECPIPPDSTKAHGITDEMVKDAPTWRQLAPRLIKAFQGADYAGFNIARFDVPVLQSEFQRVGVSTAVPEGEAPPRILDAYVLWVKQEPRTLSDAVREFTDRAHEGAHDALADVLATIDVLEGQRRKWPGLPNTITELHDLCFPPVPGQIDGGARFVFNEHGVPCINFGKHAGTPLQRLDRGFLRWMLNQTFTDEVKQIVREALDGRYPVMKEAA